MVGVIAGDEDHLRAFSFFDLEFCTAEATEFFVQVGVGCEVVAPWVWAMLEHCLFCGGGWKFGATICAELVLDRVCFFAGGIGANLWCLYVVAHSLLLVMFSDSVFFSKLHGWRKRTLSERRRRREWRLTAKP